MPDSIIIPVGFDASSLSPTVLRAVNDAQSRIRDIKLRVDSRPLGTISRDLTQFDRSLEASNARVLAFGASVGIIATVTQAFRSLISSTIDVEKRLNDIQSVFSVSQKSFQDFSSSLFNIAKNTGQSFDVVSEAARELSRQGLSIPEVLKRTNDALVLSRFAGISASEAVTDLTAAINTFKREALDSTTILNKLANVDIGFAVTTGNLAEAIKRTGSAAEDAKVSFDELVAIVTAAQQTTARGGAVIGNAFKTIFTRINRSDTLDALEELNIKVRDIEGNTLPAIRVLQNLAERFGGLSDAQKGATAQLLGGLFQINVLRASLADLGSGMSVYERALRTSSSATDQAIQRNEALNQTFSALINKTQVNLTQFFATVGKQTFEPIGKNLFGIFNTFFDAANAGSGDQKTTGQKFGQGLINGLSDFLKGPAVVIVGALLFKLFENAGKSAETAFKSVTGFNSASEKQREIQEGINRVLQAGNANYEQRLSQAKSLAEAERTVLEILRQENAIVSTQRGSNAAVAGQLVGKVKFTSPTATTSETLAGGYAPSFEKEAMAISRGVGGASSRAVPVPIRNFNFGGGHREDVVANTSEYMVRNYAGGDGSAIFNPEMIQKVGGLGNLGKLGRVEKIGEPPNFAQGNVRNLEKLLKKAKTSGAFELGNAWYPAAGAFSKIVSGEYGVPERTVHGVISALSPNNEWNRNLVDAVKTFEASKNSFFSPTAKPGEKGYYSVTTFNPNKLAAHDIASTGSMKSLTGVKRGNFDANIFGDASRVTVDRHAYRAWLNTFDTTVAKVPPNKIDEITEDYRKVAKKHGIAPRELQAILWVQYKKELEGKGQAELNFDPLSPQDMFVKSRNKAIKELNVQAKNYQPASSPSNTKALQAEFFASGYVGADSKVIQETLERMRALPLRERNGYAAEFLPLLGEGSSRRAYSLDENSVLKLPYWEAGIGQNREEARLTGSKFGRLFPDIHYADPNFEFLISQHAAQFSHHKFEELTGHSLAEAKYSILNRGKKTSEFTKLLNRARKSGLSLNDIIPHNLGVVKDQSSQISLFHEDQAITHRPVVLDAGFTQTLFEKYYGNKGKGQNLDYAGGFTPRPTNPFLQAGLDEYNKQAGLPVKTRIRPSKIALDKSFKIADAFEAMKHDPANPEVSQAYHAFRKEVADQYDFVTQKLGIKLLPWTEPGQPYGSSKEVFEDVKNNKRLYFYTGGDIPANHPLAAQAGGGLTFNDKFRGVHDVFGHATEGFQFGAQGEYNAFRKHARSFSPLAKKALAAETLGQNSWVNFGRHLRNESGLVPKKGEPGYIPQGERPFAEQKAGLLPSRFLKGFSKGYLADAMVPEEGGYRKLLASSTHATAFRFFIAEHHPELADKIFKSDPHEAFSHIPRSIIEEAINQGQLKIPNRRNLNDFLNPKVFGSAHSPLKYAPFGIFSTEYPRGQTLFESENAARNAHVFKDLYKHGYNPIPAEGHYSETGGVERSFLVPYLSEKLATQYGKTYGQESVISRRGLVDSSSGHLIASADLDHIAFGDQLQKDYTKVHLGGQDVKFSIPLQFASGYNPLIDAIRREHAAGIPLNQIYVDKVNTARYSGPVVANKLDEPNRSALIHAVNSHPNPSRAGMPNFANPPFSSQPTGVSGPASIIRQQVSKVILDAVATIDTSELRAPTKSLHTKLNQAIITALNFDLTPSQLKSSARSVYDVINTTSRDLVSNQPELNRHADLKEGTISAIQGALDNFSENLKRAQAKQQFDDRSQPLSSENEATIKGDLRRQFFDQRGLGGFSDEILKRYGKNKVFAEGTKFADSTIASRNFQYRLQQATEVEQSPSAFARVPLIGGLLDDTVGSIGIGRRFSKTNPTNPQEELTVKNQVAQLRRERASRLQDRGFQASFLLPALAGEVQSFAGIDPESKKGKQFGGVTSAVSGGISIAALAPGPAGAAVGGVIAAFGTLKAITNNLTESLDVSISKIVEGNNKKSEEILAVSNVAQALSNYRDIVNDHGSPIAVASAQTALNAQITNVPVNLRGRIDKAVASGNPEEVLNVENQLARVAGRAKGITGFEALVEQANDKQGLFNNGFLNAIGPSRASYVDKKDKGGFGSFLVRQQFALAKFIQGNGSLVDTTSKADKAIEGLSGDFDPSDITEIRNTQKTKGAREAFNQILDKSGINKEGIQRADADIARTAPGNPEKVNAAFERYVNALLKNSDTLIEGDRHIAETNFKFRTANELLDRLVTQAIAKTNLSALQGQGSRDLALSGAKGLAEVYQPYLSKRTQANNELELGKVGVRNEFLTGENSINNELIAAFPRSLPSIGHNPVIQNEVLKRFSQISANPETAFSGAQSLIQFIEQKSKTFSPDSGFHPEEVVQAKESTAGDPYIKAFQDKLIELVNKSSELRERADQQIRVLEQQRSLQETAIRLEERGSVLGGDYRKLANFDFSNLRQGFAATTRITGTEPFRTFNEGAQRDQFGRTLPYVPPFRQPKIYYNQGDQLSNYFSPVRNLDAEARPLRELQRQRANSSLELFQQGLVRNPDNVATVRSQVAEATKGQILNTIDTLLKNRNLPSDFRRDILKQRSDVDNIASVQASKLVPLTNDPTTLQNALLESKGASGDSAANIQIIAQEIKEVSKNTLDTSEVLREIAGLGDAKQNKASGYVPYVKELAAIKAGVGGAISSDRPLRKYVNGLGNVIVNSGEKVDQNFLGTGKSAILTRQMQRDFPNFALLPSYLYDKKTSDLLNSGSVPAPDFSRTNLWQEGFPKGISPSILTHKFANDKFVEASSNPLLGDSVNVRSVLKKANPKGGDLGAILRTALTQKLGPDFLLKPKDGAQSQGIITSGESNIELVKAVKDKNYFAQRAFDVVLNKTGRPNESRVHSIVDYKGASKVIPYATVDKSYGLSGRTVNRTITPEIAAQEALAKESTAIFAKTFGLKDAAFGHDIIEVQKSYAISENARLGFDRFKATRGGFFGGQFKDGGLSFHNPKYFGVVEANATGTGGGSGHIDLPEANDAYLASIRGQLPKGISRARNLIQSALYEPIANVKPIDNFFDSIGKRLAYRQGLDKTSTGVDLAYFKQVAEEGGHKIPDRILRQVIRSYELYGDEAGSKHFDKVISESYRVATATATRSRGFGKLGFRSEKAFLGLGGDPFPSIPNKKVTNPFFDFLKGKGKNLPSNEINVLDQSKRGLVGKGFDFLNPLHNIGEDFAALGKSGSRLKGLLKLGGRAGGVVTAISTGYDLYKAARLGQQHDYVGEEAALTKSGVSLGTLALPFQAQLALTAGSVIGSYIDRGIGKLTGNETLKHQEISTNVLADAAEAVVSARGIATHAAKHGIQGASTLDILNPFHKFAPTASLTLEDQLVLAQHRAQARKTAKEAARVESVKRGSNYPSIDDYKDEDESAQQTALEELRLRPDRAAQRARDAVARALVQKAESNQAAIQKGYTSDQEYQLSRSGYSRAQIAQVTGRAFNLDTGEVGAARAKRDDNRVFNLDTGEVGAKPQYGPSNRVFNLETGEVGSAGPAGANYVHYRERSLKEILATGPKSDLEERLLTQASLAKSQIDTTHSLNAIRRQQTLEFQAKQRDQQQHYLETALGNLYGSQGNYAQGYVPSFAGTSIIGSNVSGLTVGLYEGADILHNASRYYSQHYHGRSLNAPYAGRQPSIGDAFRSNFGGLGSRAYGQTSLYGSSAEKNFSRIGLNNINDSDLLLSGLVGGDVNGQNLSDAIAREKDALNARGYYASGLVQVGYSPRIGGLGVYNKIDEPFGLKQGIDRVVREGGNPRTAGTPNYADQSSQLLEAIKALEGKITGTQSSVDVSHSHSVQVSVGGEVRSSHAEIAKAANEEAANFKSRFEERLRSLEVSHAKSNKDFVLRPQQV